MEGMRKHSKKRQAILETIRSTASHPGAQWVYDQLRPQIPDLSLGTVYRNIGVFVADGELVSVGVVNGEERFDGDTTPHPHFICSRCGRVEDFPSAGGASLGHLTEIGEAAGRRRVDLRRTIFRGLCEDCAAHAQERPAARRPAGSGGAEETARQENGNKIKPAYAG
jgi:Fur family peroxide stress response transcriptional regulator